MSKKASVKRLAHLVILSEFTLPTLFILLAQRKDVYIVATAPQFRLFKALFQYLTGLLVRCRLVGDRNDIVSNMPWIEGLPGWGAFNDGVDVIEAKLYAATLPVIETSVRLQAYAYAMRKVACMTAHELASDVMALTRWLDANSHRDWMLYGATPLLDLIHKLYFNRPSGFRSPVPGWVQRPLNLLNATVSLVSSAAWLAQHMHRHVVQRDYHLGLNTNSDVEIKVLDRVMDDPSRALVVYPSPAYQAYYGHLYDAYPQCYLDDCTVTPTTVLRLIRRAAADLVSLWHHHGGSDCGLFTRYCGLVGSRVHYAAFFAQNRFAFFWCRDDYAADHIIRSQEIRAIGGKTMGINHGLPPNVIAAEWRQIDFDIYYTFGRHLHEKYYRDCWPAHMRIVPVGNIHMTPEYRCRLEAARPPDIAYFVTAHVRLDKILNEVFAIARHFPERKVYLKMKPRRAVITMDLYEQMLAQAPPNIVRVSELESPYELMFKIRYALTSGSTLGAEALQFKVVSFIFHLQPELRFLYLDFPKLIARSGADVISRIENIEAGREIYRFEDFEPLIAMSGPCIYDLIRSDLGLPGPVAAKVPRPEPVDAEPGE